MRRVRRVHPESPPRDFESMEWVCEIDGRVHAFRLNARSKCDLNF